jgi:hypothetical protein
MRRVLLTTLLIAACLSFAPIPHAQQQHPILQAMQDEMKRAMDGLRLKNEPPPYYIAYAIEDTTSVRLVTKLGAVVNDSPARTRMFRVEVRVGDYNLDSSRFLGGFDSDPGILPMYAQYMMAAPLDDDYDVMRRQMWLATDIAYKRAVQTLSKKQAAAQSRAADPEPIPDFSKETPSETVLPVPAAPPALSARTWTDDLRKISAVFLAYPDVDSSEASLSESQGVRYYLNSEGFKVVEPIAAASLRVAADTQAGDGMVLRDSFTAIGKRVNELPPASNVLARAQDLAGRLTSLRSAPLGEDFTGPVLVEGQAASVLLAQTLVPLFLSQRAPEMEGAAGAALARLPLSPFLTRIGSRVLPEGFSVADTPSLQRFGDALVPASYVVDDDGVPAKDVTLVQAGRLVTLLTGRTPQKRLLQSNGHARGGGAQAAVFQMESTRGLPAGELKAKYLDLLKAQGRPFGYIVRGVIDSTEVQATNIDEIDMDEMEAMYVMTMGGLPGTPRIGPAIARAVKVLPDGTEQPVRGLNFANVQYTVYRTIAEASRERTLYTCRPVTGMSMTTAMPMSMRTPVVSIIVPNLLFEELEIQRGKEIPLKRPVVASPLKK